MKPPPRRPSADRLRTWRAVAAIALAAAVGSARADEPSALRLGGYNKSFAIGSRTLDAAEEPYSLLLNRTRLKATWLQPAWLELHVENDTELRAGDYLKTAQAGSEAAAPGRHYWDLRSTWSDRRDARVTNDFFRAFAKLSKGEADMILGRQRIALGTGRLWSTLDMLNPLNPLQIERDEYVGVDALLLEQRLASLSKWSLVYAPQPGGGSPRWVAGWRTHAAGADLGLTVARYWGDVLLATDVATQVGGLGLRGELTATRPRDSRRYLSASIGLDYAFENTLTLSFEAYASSQSPADRLRQMAADPLRAAVQPFGTRYAGAVASYEFTPLLKLTLVLLGNLRDDSRFGSAALAWSLSESVVLQGGIQRFSGRADSEYGRGQALNYLQLQWFF